MTLMGFYVRLSPKADTTAVAECPLWVKSRHQQWHDARLGFLRRRRV